jgi:hypothetical protein
VILRDAIQLASNDVAASVYRDPTYAVVVAYVRELSQSEVDQLERDNATVEQYVDNAFVDVPVFDAYATIRAASQVDVDNAVNELRDQFGND